MATVTSPILCWNATFPRSWKRFFPEPFLLQKLIGAGLPVVRFAVSSPSLYREFKDMGEIATSAAEQVIQQLRKAKLVSQDNRIVVGCPFVDASAPLPNPANVVANTSAVRGILGAFYRAWKSDKFDYYRVANGISTNIDPLLLFYPDQGPTGLAFSRSPRTGERTSVANWEKGLIGAVNRIDSDTVSVLHASEMLLCNPITLVIVDGNRDNSLLICGVQHLDLTNENKLHAFIDLLQEGRWTLSEFLAQISPRWFRGRPKLHVSAPSFQTSGLPIGGGAVAGPAYLRARSHSRISQEGILVLEECLPEDVREILKSQAVVTTRGGVSSHAAVMCRFIGKPCISGASALEIDYAQRVIRCGGAIAPEGTSCMMDGMTGEVAFLIGGPGTADLSETLAVSTSRHLRRLRALLDVQLKDQMKRITGSKVKVLADIQSMFNLLDEP